MRSQRDVYAFAQTQARLERMKTSAVLLDQQTGIHYTALEIGKMIVAANEITGMLKKFREKLPTLRIPSAERPLVLPDPPKEPGHGE